MVDEMTREEKFRELLNTAGFSSVREFSKVVGVDASNISKNIHGARNNSIQLNRIFKFAKVLRVDVKVLLNLFYPDEMNEVEAVLSEVQE